MLEGDVADAPDDLVAFECYRHYYAKREEAQRILQREMLKKSNTGFAGYIERIKHATMENGTRLPLRELLMDPVQRIPRYTMMFKSALYKIVCSSLPWFQI